jgi:predicted DNA-binding transcriptional regulator AlpA
MDGNSNRVVRMRDLPSIVGLSRAAIYKAIAGLDFPPGMRLTKNGRAVGWLLSDVLAWVESRKSIVAGRDRS